MFTCLAAMLPDFQFLQGPSHPGGSILPLEAVQLKEVFRQHGIPLVNGIHIFFPLLNKVWVFPCGHTVHSTAVETSLQNVKVTPRKNADEGRHTSVNWSDDRRSGRWEKVSQGLLCPGIRGRGPKEGLMSSSV